MCCARKRGRPKQDPEVRRRQILGAAAGLFARHGYRGTDIQRVADALGIAKGTIYLYFDSKDALFMATIDRAIERLADHVTRAVSATTGPRQKIEAMVRSYLHFIEKDRHFAEMIIQAGGEFRSHAEHTYFRIYSENAMHIERIIRDGIASGEFRECPPAETASALANLLHGTLISHLLGAGMPDFLQTSRSTVSFIMLALERERTVQ